jgi:hypothetical protein
LFFSFAFLGWTLSGSKSAIRCPRRAGSNKGQAIVQIETKYLRLSRPVTLGEQIDGWRVCWLGGWDKGRIFYVVMVMKVQY